jgi:hypothetical protein
MPEIITIPKLECIKCGHRWYPRTPNLPLNCPNATCHTPNWNKPRGDK